MDTCEAALEDEDNEAEQAREPDTHPDPYAVTPMVRALEAHPTARLVYYDS